jgi:hypothetical protein
MHLLFLWFVLGSSWPLLKLRCSVLLVNNWCSWDAIFVLILLKDYFDNGTSEHTS